MNIIISIYLVIAAYEDIRTYTISAKLSAVATLCLIMINIFASINFCIPNLVLGALPGLLILFVSFITKQSIGYGDGVVSLILGCFLGIQHILFILTVAFALSAIFALILMTKKRSRGLTLPFVPFILSAYFLSLLFFL